jgi:signal transduction histidine kinase
MKIRTKLTLLFTSIITTILLGFAAIIYLSAKEDREQEFYTRLKQEAVTKTKLFLNAKVSNTTLQEIYKSNREILNEVEVAIYDSSFNLLYHDAEDIDLVKETPDMINKIHHNKELRLYKDKWQIIGINYHFAHKSYIVVATAIDTHGYKKLQTLLETIVLVFIFSLVVIYVAARYFSSRAFEPIRRMTEQAKLISATNLDLRLNDNENKDELSELAKTFNEMLIRLENSFDAQKHFVSNISHEIRTPLAAIITELEISLGKDRSNQDYKITIQDALKDAKKLVRLSNSLLDFAKASYDPAEIAFKTIRIDEVLLDAMQQVQKANPNYHVDIHFDTDFEEDAEISLKGNEYLLKTAFINLFENGCKFSDNHQCIANITLQHSTIIISFSDIGIGITAEDIQNIFTPFYRGDNKTFAEGNGIGLPLTQKIIDLHNGTISVSSVVNQGTTFKVLFSSLK